MTYKFTYKTTAFELWQLSMYYMYGSMVGVCNIVFTLAMVALIISKWQVFGGLWRTLLVFGLCLFTLIQPIIIYLRARKQAANIKEATTLEANDRGLQIQVGNQSSDIPWSKVKKISLKPTLMIIFSDTTHGFVLTNRVLGAQRNEFYNYVASKIN